MAIPESIAASDALAIPADGQAHAGAGKLPDYIPALDGFRAIAILLVVFSHAGMGAEKWFPGMLGVVCFFVISGFLITRQIIAEIEQTRHFNIPMFYMRRILRLLPTILLYLFLFTPVLRHLGASITTAHIASGILYMANYYHIFIGYPPYNPMPILWSLSVEEHYYIVFPFLMLAFRQDMKAALPLLISLLFAALAWRAALYNLCHGQTLPVCGVNEKARMHGTDAIFDCIIYGAAAAFALRYHYREIRSMLIHKKAFAAAIILLIFSLILRNPLFRDTLRYSMQSACCAVIILNVIHGNPARLERWLSHPWMVFTGRISYALYLMHFGVLVTLEAAWGKQYFDSPIESSLYLILSFLIAACSYFLVEKPMITVRKKFFHSSTAGVK